MENVPAEAIKVVWFGLEEEGVEGRGDRDGNSAVAVTVS
jgi:hypothetical protein